MTATSLDRDQVVFRKTNARKGRHLAVTPANSATRHLSYGRIRLDAEEPDVSFEAGGEEVGLVCFQGSATVTVDGQAFTVGRYDVRYIPRESPVVLKTAAGGGLPELRPPVAPKFTLKEALRDYMDELWKEGSRGGKE